MAQVEKGNAMGCLVTGVITGVCGFATFISGCVWISVGGGGGFGVWCGIPMLIIAVIGILVYLKKSKGAAIAYLVLNIFWIILNAVQTIIAGLAALIFAVWVEAVENSGCYNYAGKCYCPNSREALTYSIDDCDTLYTMRDSLTCIMAFCAIGAISCFAGSIIGCCIACCGSPAPNVQPVVVVNQQPPQQVVITSTHQGAVYPPGQPMYPPPPQGDMQKVDAPPAY